MAEESSGQEKTEQPTARRLADARKKGDVAKSMEIPSAAVLLAGLLTLYFLGDFMLERLYMLLRHYLGNLHTIEIIKDNMVTITRESMLYSAMIVAPVMAVVLVTALAANYAQIGIIFTGEKIKPDLKKIDPIKGVQNKFSMQTLAHLIKSILKIIFIGAVAFYEVKKSMPALLPLMDQEPFPIFIFVVKTSFWIFLKAAIIIAILAALDYAFQKWQFTNKMKMTKQEVKEEAKMTEGDPQVKGRIRSIQMQMARRRMMEEVPSADVIITNPVRLAIALRYDSLTMSAPVVVAKGAGVIARRIREVAAEHSIPIVEDRPLAQALFKTVDIDDPIPENLFEAVAEVLAYVYSLKQKSGNG